MRFDTRRVSAHLVTQLQKGRPHVEVTYDSGDLIRVSLENNAVVQIYLIENPITVYEIMGIVAANTGIGTYSLFILWRDLLLPIDGVRYQPNDWMEALLTLHGDKIYAFDAYYGEDFYIFPVYFEGTGRERMIRHGTTIDATRLYIETISITSPLVAGVWRIANFEASRTQANPSDETPVNVPYTAMTVYYRQLGIPETSGQAAVKRAYRKLARKYHPDLNTDPAATVKMQQINDAYERILADLKQRGLLDDK